MIRKISLFFLLIITSFCAEAQYTEVINSNKPGFSQSPYSVGKRVYQFESSLFYRKADALETFSNPKAVGINLQFRTGLISEKLEINLSTALQNNTFAFKNVFESSYTKTSLSQLTLGAKYLVYAPKYEEKGKEIRSWKKRHSFGWERWIPHVSVYAGANFGMVLNDFHARGGITPKVGVLLQNELSNKLNIITNVYYNYMFGYLPEWSYILTATYNFNQQWSGFAEHQALFNKQEKQSNLGLGVAYLLSNDLQLNSTVKATFQAENTIGIYAGLGASYRIDRHRDDFVALDEYGNPIDPINKESYNKGFFGRMFDKVKGVFKKKDKTEVEVDEDLSKPKTEEEIKEASGGRTRKKSILGDIAKDDKKAKKQTIKDDKKLSKKELKAKGKALKEIEKQKAKEAKEKQKAEDEIAKEEAKIQAEIEKEEAKAAKEEAKLQAEIEKLEKDLAKDEAKAKQAELDRQYEEELARKKKEAEELKKLGQDENKDE